MMKSTKSSARLLLPAIGLLACISAPLRAADDSEIVAQRSQVREMSGDMLATLYEYQPAARFAIEHSAGYGVFSTFGIKLLFAGGQSGKGIVHNMRTGRDTFMKMIGAQAGLGFGVSRTTVIWVFETQRALSNFVKHRLGIRRQGRCVGDDANLGRDVCRRNIGVARRLRLSPHRYRTRRRAHGDGGKIFPGSRSQLMLVVRRANIAPSIVNGSNDARNVTWYQTGNLSHNL